MFRIVSAGAALIMKLFDVSDLWLSELSVSNVSELKLIFTGEKFENSNKSQNADTVDTKNELNN